MLACMHACRAEEPSREKLEPAKQGEVQFLPAPTEKELPKRFQLSNHRFAFTERPWRHVKNAVRITQVEFPSPMETPFKANNQVHCEFFAPLDGNDKKQSKTPGVIVLHILGGDFELSRTFCMALARRGSSALFVKMPYYGPRRDPKSGRRMISENPEELVEGMTQAILDIRRATAWLGSQPSVDAKRLGIFGVSLGGITGALATEMEPRLHNACFLLAGGDVGKIVWESPKTRRAAQRWLNMGRTKEEFEQIVREVDPAHHAPLARKRRILMLNARDDEVVPRAATDALWNGLGKPPIVWYDGGHYSVARHFFDAVKRVGDFYENSAALP